VLITDCQVLIADYRVLTADHRMLTADCQLPTTNIQIKKGTNQNIPSRNGWMITLGWQIHYK